MKKRSVIVETVFLRAVVVLVGVAALAFLLWEPHLEGRNANATPFEIYFHDPFLAYAYFASIPFFVSLYQAFKVLGYARTNKLFSFEVIKALRIIKYCAIAVIAFVVFGEVLIILPKADELPPPIFIGLLLLFGSTVVATATSVFEKALQKAISTKPENPSTSET